MNARICFTGAQGTGKTTILNKFKDLGVPVITEVVRNLKKEKGIKINLDGGIETQNMIWQAYKELLSNEKSYISDRCLVDVISYTEAGIQSHPDMEGLLEEQYVDLVKFNQANPDIIYIYFPIEFPVVDDGVRSIDEKYRKDVDKIIKHNLDILNLKYLTISGSVEDRYKQIIDYVGPDNF